MGRRFSGGGPTRLLKPSRVLAVEARHILCRYSKCQRLGCCYRECPFPSKEFRAVKCLLLPSLTSFHPETPCEKGELVVEPAKSTIWMFGPFLSPPAVSEPMNTDARSLPPLTFVRFARQVPDDVTVRDELVGHRSDSVLRDRSPHPHPGRRYGYHDRQPRR